MAPRRFGICAALLAAAIACASDAAAQDAAPDNSAITIISRGPTAEFRIRGVSLKSVRSDDAQNEVAFDFNGPVSDEIFVRLKNELPDWIDLAYAGYDNAVIRAKRPATFLARAEPDGFSMRIMPRDAETPGDVPGREGVPNAAPPAAMPGRDWRAAPIARASAERPFDAHLRAGYDTLRTRDAAVVRIASNWRHDKAGTLYTSDGNFDIPVDGDIRLMGSVRGVVANARAVRQLSGAVAPFNDHDVSGSAGLSFAFDGARIALEGLYGRLGFGGRAALRSQIGDWLLSFNAAYHEPYTDTAEAVALKGARDSTALYAAGQIFDGLWATGEAFGARYGVKSDQDVARTAGWHVGLRYEIAGWPLSLLYDGDGEYIVDAHKLAGPAPSPYIPLSIRTRELHQFGAALSDNWADSLWFDLYGGYAIDRYGKDGPYGGAALRFTPEPGFDIALNGRYSTAAERQGESGNVLSAGFSLTYAWGAVDAPIFEGQ